MGDPKKITELWAWIVTEHDGGEGVPASNRIVPGQFLPLMGADEDRARSLKPEAVRIAAIGNLPLKLMRFRDGQTVETVKGDYDA